MLYNYKKNGGSRDAYSEKFLGPMAERQIEKIDQATLDGACLLCSEDKSQCYRRLVAESLKGKWNGVEIAHL
jgi:hypothetical protein